MRAAPHAFGATVSSTGGVRDEDRRDEYGTKLQGLRRPNRQRRRRTVRVVRHVVPLQLAARRAQVRRAEHGAARLSCLRHELRLRRVRSRVRRAGGERGGATALSHIGAVTLSAIPKGDCSGKVSAKSSSFTSARCFLLMWSAPSFSATTLSCTASAACASAAGAGSRSSDGRSAGGLAPASSRRSARRGARAGRSAPGLPPGLRRCGQTTALRAGEPSPRHSPRRRRCTIAFGQHGAATVSRLNDAGRSDADEVVQRYPQLRCAHARTSRRTSRPLRAPGSYRPRGGRRKQNQPWR